MRQRLLMITEIVTLSVVLLVVFSGSEAASRTTTDGLIAIACGSDTQAANANASIRAAAADVVSARWFAQEAFPETRVPSDQLFQYSGDPAQSEECRQMGLATQVTRIFSQGDPGVDGPISAKNAQAYADSVATAPTPVRGYIQARAVMFFISNGFAIVPGGLAEDLNRIQTCLNGQIVTNQGNKVAGVALDCSQELIRRAVADVIAPGFYLAFRAQPAVNIGCQGLRTQAESGETVEARWAAAKAYVFDNQCAAKNVAGLTDIAQNGASKELRMAAVSPLAEVLAGSTTPSRQLLGNAGETQLKNIVVEGSRIFGGQAGSPTDELKLANAFAAGLKLASPQELQVLSDCSPTTAATGPLSFWAIAGQGQAGKAVIAPLTRYHTSSCDGGLLTQAGDEVRLTIEEAVPGASLPLKSYILLK